jgi:alginate O-acetyltransferase complex protein AlgI
MLFNSSLFGLFIAVVVPLYALLKGDRARKVLLLVASYAFYAGWDYRYCSLLAISTLVDYVAGGRMHRTEAPRRRRGWLVASLVTNLGLLATFKYGNFVMENVAAVAGVDRAALPYLPGTIPVGISFYTFQTLSYTIDIYRRKTVPAEGLLDFALFVSFFAQLVAGPIVRSTEFLPQIKTMGEIRLERLAEGTHRFLLGLFKKVVIADNVGLYVDHVFASPESFGAVTLWCAPFCFALQLYCDFSAYTDMALGIGRAFNLELPENFDVPYLARSITEFWGRWHMTLSRWLRDYLYIPLGGSRGSERRTYFNLFVTMLLCGLWHGAAWNFVLFGAVHGAILCVERRLGVRAKGGEERGMGAKGVESGGRIEVSDWLRSGANMILFALTLVVFRSQGVPAMLVHFRRMFTEWPLLDEAVRKGLLWTGALVGLIVLQRLLLAYRLKERVWDRLPAPVQAVALAVLVLVVSWFRVDEVAFIYFQF